MFKKPLTYILGNSLCYQAIAIVMLTSVSFHKLLTEYIYAGWIYIVRLHIETAHLVFHDEIYFHS